MRTKVTLYETYNWNNHDILILIELGRKTKQWHKEYEKYQCCIQSREAFYKKLFFKISQYSQKNNCVGVFFLIKMQTFSPATLLKEDSNIVVFLTKFLRTAILKNIYERLFLRVFPFMLFSYATYEVRMFSQKQNKKCHSKTQLVVKKTYLFMMFFITLFFSISPLHVRWLLPYIIKNNSSVGL